MKLFFKIVCLCILNFGFSQTEIQLKNKLKKELQKMELQGATFVEVSDKFLLKDSKKYVWNIEEFYRSILFFEFLADKMIVAKISNGTLTEKDSKINDKIKNKYKNYQEYLDYKKTLEAKENWESNIGDGILKLVVSDINNFNRKDKERFKELKALFDRDSFFTSFMITDAKETKTIIKE